MPAGFLSVQQAAICKCWVYVKRSLCMRFSVQRNILLRKRRIKFFAIFLFQVLLQKKKQIIVPQTPSFPPREQIAKNPLSKMTGEGGANKKISLPS